MSAGSIRLLHRARRGCEADELAASKTLGMQAHGRKQPARVWDVSGSTYTASDGSGRAREHIVSQNRKVIATAIPTSSRKRARTESDANAAMLLLSCMRREDSLPALGEPIAA